MTRLQMLRKRAIALQAQMQTRLASAVNPEGHAQANDPRTFNEAEQAGHDTDQGALDALVAQIATEERLATFVAPTVDSAVPAPAAPLDGDIPVAIVVGEDRAVGQPFGSLGEQLLAIRAASDPTNPVMDPRLLAVRAATGMNESVPSDGGFAVQKDFIAGIKERMHNEGQIFSRVNRTPIGANANGLKFNVIKENSRADGSRGGGVRAYWTDEAAALTASKTTLRQVELQLEKLTALMYLTGELQQDATALSARANRDFGRELLFKTEDAYWEGDGAGKPLGIVGHAGTVVVAKEAAQAASTVVSANIVKMWARMRNRSNSVWMYNQEIEPQLLQMTQAVGTGGTVTYMPPGGLSASPYATLMGRPMIPVEYASALGTAGDIVLCDWDAYESIDKGGPKYDSSIHVRFLFDEEVFRAIYRVDGQPLYNSALTPFKGSATTAHFVTLATRA